MSTFANVTPIRDDLEPVYVDKRDLVNALNQDVDRIAREARDRGRIEGCICMAVFVVVGFTLGSFWMI